MCVCGEESHLTFCIATIRTVRVSLHQLPNGETVGRFAGGEREVLSHGWPQMGRWLVPFICRAKAYRQSRCCIRPCRRCLPRSSRHLEPTMLVLGRGGLHREA